MVRVGVLPQDLQDVQDNDFLSGFRHQGNDDLRLLSLHLIVFNHKPVK